MHYGRQCLSILSIQKDTNHAGDFDYTRAPTLRLKVPYWEGEYKIELYDDGHSLSHCFQMISGSSANRTSTKAVLILQQLFSVVVYGLQMESLV